MKIVKGQKIKDTKKEYQNDTGVIDTVQNTSKGEYVTVAWDENTIHGEGSYGRYKTKKFGAFNRFKSI